MTKMIEINLLPKELRKQKKTSLEMPDIPVIPIAIGVLAALIIIHTLSLFLFYNNQNLSKSLQNKWEQMEPQRVKTEKVTKEINGLREKTEAVRLIAEPQLNVAKLLNGLNRAMIPNIWLSKMEMELIEEKSGRGKSLTYTRDRVLDITGFALGKSEIATSNVAKFITSLKGNKKFSEYFDDIELENMQNRELLGEEVMRFKLLCKFKEKYLPKKKEENSK